MPRVEGDREVTSALRLTAGHGIPVTLVRQGQHVPAQLQRPGQGMTAACRDIAILIRRSAWKRNQHARNQRAAPGS
ncbi:hypothetical protein GCM10027428_26640 [Haliea atlantica]